MEAVEEAAVRLLGVPEVHGGRAAHFFPSKGFQLLALLVRAPSARITREQAASLLWDSVEASKGLANLRQLLVRMRRSEPSCGELVVANGQILALGTGAQATDVRIFETLSASENLDEVLRALALVRGEFLEGITDASEEFRHWLACERATVRERFFAAASSALIELTRYGRARTADLETIGERMLTLDPEREETYRSLIEAHGRNGDPGRAQQIHSLLKAMLQREFGTTPVIETAAVVRKVFASARSHSPDRENTPKGEKRPRVAFMTPASPGRFGRTDILKALIEDLANELSRFRTFAVLAPHSSFRIEHNCGLPLDNSQLRADYVASSFVKLGGGREILVLRMTNCESAEIVWAGEFPIAREDLARTFRMLSVRVASSLAAGIERDVRSGLHVSGSASAYRHFLEGDIRLKTCELGGLRRARAAYRKAIAADGSFGAAHARVAQTLHLEWLMLGGNDPALLHAGREQARIAMDLDPGAALGHCMSAVIALYQRNFDLAAEKFADAETLHPNSADLLVQHADALTYMGEPDAAWQRFDKAIDLNPLPPDRYWWVGASIARRKGNFLQAIELCGRLASDEPVLRLLAISHALAGNRREARAYGHRLLEVYPGGSAAEMAKLVPFRDSDDLASFVQGLRLAGVP